MDKLRLELDDLKVESFEIASDNEDEGGTVKANGITELCSEGNEHTCAQPEYTLHCELAPAC